MNQDSTLSNQATEEEFDLMGLLFRYLRYWYWFIAAVVISLGWAYIELKKTTPIYVVNATLLIKDEKIRKQGEDVIQDLSVIANKQIENEIEVLKSRTLLGKVIDSLNLGVSYWSEGRSRDIEMYKDAPIYVLVKRLETAAYGSPLYVKYVNENKYALVDNDDETVASFDFSQLAKCKQGEIRVFKSPSFKPFSQPIKVIFQSREALIGGFQSNLQVAPVGEYTSFISLALETPIPEKGKAILSKLLDEYAFGTLEDKNREATNTLRFIEERLKLVTSELGDIEQDVETYRRRTGVNDLSSEGTLFLGKSEENDAKLNELEIQEKIISGVEEYISSTQIGNIAPATLMVNDPVLSNYISQYVQLEADRSKVAQTVQAGNPYLETIVNQMRNIKQAIRENLSNQRANLQVSRGSLNALNRRLEGAMSSIPRKEREYVGIKRQAGIKENLYLLLLQKREETALSYASTVTDSRVIDQPYATGGPVKPDKKNKYLIALLIGIAIPTLLIALKDLLTTTVQSRKEVEQKTGMKIFGEVSFDPKASSSEEIDLRSRSFSSEQIRMIRSNMHFLFPHTDNAHTILFTSSIGGEGKSFLTLNIALSLSMLGKKVLIMGLDLRKPKVDQYLDVQNRKGISNFLIGQLTPNEVIVKSKYENIDLAPSGPVPPNPSELISMGRLKEFFKEVKHQYDYILIDTPPMGLVTDAALLAEYADAAFYVIRHQVTPRIHLAAINDLNKRKVFKSFSIIFNGIDYKKSADYGYGYGHGYGYEKGYGYYGVERKTNLLGEIIDKVRRYFNRFKTTQRTP